MPRKILIVEDDFDVRQSLSHALEEEGYSVAAAANGKDALDYLDQNSRPCVILLDLMMPVMNGYDFRAEQLNQAKLAKIPVILLSADPNIAKRASELRVAGYIGKPIDLDVLLDAVKKYCA